MMMQDRAEIVLVKDNPSDIELALQALEKNNPSNPIQVLRDGAEALEYVFGQAHPQVEAFGAALSSSCLTSSCPR